MSLLAEPKEFPAAATPEAAYTGVYRFGPYQLDPAAQKLLRNGEAVRIGSRALEILAVLLESAGDLVEKDALMARVWPTTVVDEAALRVHISALRRALDAERSEQYVVNVPGRGYRFVAPVERLARSPSDATESSPLRADSLPTQLTQPLGRDEAIADLAETLQRERLVTIVGPGGIGKTTLALALAARVKAAFRDGVCFVDLSLVTDPQFVPAALASALHRPVGTGDIMATVTAYLRPRSLLIILDCCEHVIESAASVVEQLLSAGAELRVLATSREALRARGEVVEQLDPLQSPPESPNLTAAQALRFSAIQLLERSAKSSARDFQLTDENAALSAELCRRLDGIPLAIELAAALTGTLGLRMVLDGLGQRFQVLAFGRRTSLPRHQTFAAALAWSYELLTDNQRAVFRRLATFAGRFTLEAAVEVAADPDLCAAEALGCVVALAGKSLLAIDRSQDPPEFRLLETTRAYACLQVGPAGERDAAALRHARYHLSLLAAKDWEAYDPRRERGAIAGFLEEVRVALDWAYTLTGETDLAINLTLAADRAWSELAWVAEGVKRLRQALTLLDATANPDPRVRMQVLTALGTAHSLAQITDENLAIFHEALLLAQSLDNRAYQLRALWGLIHCYLNIRQAAKGLEFAHRFQTLALERPEEPEALIAEHLLGLSYLEAGQITVARQYLEPFLARYSSPPRSHAAQLGFDKRVTGRVGLAVALWVQGQPVQSFGQAEGALLEAKERRHEPSIFYALGLGVCLIGLLTWHVPVARRHLSAFDEVSQQYPAWESLARAHRGVLEGREGNYRRGRQLLEDALTGHSPVHMGTMYSLLTVELADLCRLMGDLDAAEEAADLALALQNGPEGFVVICHALRAKAEIQAAHGAEASLRSAEAMFRECLRLAPTQNGRVFELAAATGLARLWRSTGRTDEARRLLQPVVGRISEGLDLAPAVSARSLLTDLDRQY